CNAIDVLRAVSITKFADASSAIFQASRQEEESRLHLLLGMTTFAARPYLRSPELWHAMVESLERIVRVLDESSAHRSVHDKGFRILYDRSRGRLAMANLSGLSNRQVWHELLSRFGDQYARHGRGAAVRRLEQDVGRPIDPGERTVAWATGLYDDWLPL